MRVPFPGKNILDYLKKKIQKLIIKPPRHAPKASAHTSGCNGKPRASFSAREIAILTIIVVNGMLSTKADAKADTYN